MKTKNLLLILFLIFTQSSFAQRDSSKTQIIIYDFVKGEYTDIPKTLFQNRPIVLKIININRLFYKPMVEGRDIENYDSKLYDIPSKTVLNKIEEYTSTKPESLSFSFTYSLQKNKDELSKESRNQDEIDRKNIEPIKNEIEEIQKSISINIKKINDNEFLILKEKQKIDNNNSVIAIFNKRINENIQLTESEQKAFGSKKDENKGKNDSINILVAENNTLNLEIKDKNENIKIKNFLYQKIIDDVKSRNLLLVELQEHLFQINSNYDKFYESTTKLYKIAKRYNNFIEKINRPDFNKIDYELIKISNTNDSFEKTTILNPVKLIDYYSTISTYDSQYNEFLKGFNSSNFESVIQKLNSFKEFKPYIEFLKNDLNRLKTSVLEIYKNADNANLFAKLNQVEILDRELSQTENYTYVSDPIQGKGDILEFGVEIKPKNDYKDALSIYQPRKFTYSGNLRGGVRLDFGVGLSVDFGKKDENYDFEIKPDSTKYLRNISQNDYTPQLVGLLHASWRSDGNFAGGLSLGTSLDVANFDINSIYFGASLLIGRQNKVIITAGPSFRSVKQLRANYRQYVIDDLSNAISLPLVIPISEELYVKNFKTGFFFAITYNLTSKQKSTLLRAKE